MAIRLVTHTASRGAAAARNSAADHAHGAVFLFLDADTSLHAGSLPHTIDRFRADPGLAAVNGGANLDPANPKAGFTPRYRAMIDYVQQNIRAPQKCSFFTPRCGAIRRNIFFQAGRFDETFIGAAVEDYEFGHRLSGIAPIHFDERLSAKHHYAEFWKTSRKYFTRVRGWASLFMTRRKFENYGAATGAAGIGSIFGLLWIPALALPNPFREALILTSLAGFCAGYRDIFGWSLRLKGVPFLFRSVFLTWWLCCVIVPAAILGMLDGIIPHHGRHERPQGV